MNASFGRTRANFTALATVILILAAAAADATVVTITASDAGFVTMAGGSAKGDGTVAPPAKYNYSVGREVHYGSGALGAPLVAMDRKNYFVFDLTSVTTPIASAVLKAYAGPAVAPPYPGGTHGYESLDPTETYALGATPDFGGAMGDIMALASSSSPLDFDSPMDPLVGMAASLYTKLAIGMPLGFSFVSPADDGTIKSVPLSPAGVGYLNTFLGSKVILAGFLPTAMPPALPKMI